MAQFTRSWSHLTELQLLHLSEIMAQCFLLVNEVAQHSQHWQEDDEKVLSLTFFNTLGHRSKGSTIVSKRTTPGIMWTRTSQHWTSVIHTSRRGMRHFAEFSRPPKNCPSGFELDRSQFYILYHWYLSQGILKGEVSLYRWPPVWLVWISLFCK